MLTSDKEQEKRWAEHVEEILNREDLAELPDIPEAPDDLDVNLEPQAIGDIVNVLRNSRTGRHRFMTS